MKIEKSAMAGTMESSDIMITVSPNPGKGVEIQLESNVAEIFGDSIRETIQNVLREFSVDEALVEAVDRGALDCTIRARTQCAVCRANGITYDWKQVK